VEANGALTRRETGTSAGFPKARSGRWGAPPAACAGSRLACAV